MRNTAGRWRSRRRLGSAVAVALVAMVAGPVAGAARAATATVVSHFVYRGSEADTHDDFVYLSNGATFNQPGNLLFVTPNWNPGGVEVGTLESAPLGVLYDDFQEVWAVFREDGTAMPLREGFNVLVVPANKIGASAFTVLSTAGNTAGNSVYLNNALLNGHPRAKLQITQNLTPGGTPRARNPHHVGVWYDTAAAKWAIFNEDSAAMPVGVAFNVLVGQSLSNGGKASLLQTTKANRSGDVVFISDAQTTGNPNNVTFATQVWNPNGAVTGAANNTEVGVFYDTASDREGVFNENLSAPPLHAGFDLLVFPS